MNTKKIETKEAKSFFVKHIKSALRNGEIGGKKNILIWNDGTGQYWFDWDEKGYSAGNIHCSPMCYNEGDGIKLGAAITGIKEYKYDGDEKRLTKIVNNIIETYNELVEIAL